MTRAVLLLAALPFAVAGCQSAQAPPQAASATLQAGVDESAGGPTSGPVGSVGHDGAVTITVQSVKTARQTTVKPGYGDPTVSQNGWFVVADVLEENTGFAPAATHGWYVQTADGSDWSWVSLGSPSFDPALPGLGQIAAGGKQRGNVVFDIPQQHGTVVYGSPSSAPIYGWTF